MGDLQEEKIWSLLSSSILVHYFSTLTGFQ